MNHTQTLSDRNIVDALRNRGFKATPQRIAICRYAMHSHDHPEAIRIHKEVRREYPTVSLATVYKTIDVLKKLEMLQELPILDGKTRYDSNTETHLNLVCVRCGAVRDLDGLMVREMVSRITRTAKFDVRGQSLAVYGICQECGLKKTA